jgi:hypothetical protein
MHTEFWWGNLTERDRLEDLCLDNGNIEMAVERRRVGGCGADRDKWRVFANFHKLS